MAGLGLPREIRDALAAEVAESLLGTPPVGQLILRNQLRVMRRGLLAARSRAELRDALRPGPITAVALLIATATTLGIHPRSPDPAALIALAIAVWLVIALVRLGRGHLRAAASGDATRWSRTVEITAAIAAIAGIGAISLPWLRATEGSSAARSLSGAVICYGVVRLLHLLTLAPAFAGSRPDRPDGQSFW